MKSVQLKCYRCGKENDVIDMRYAALNRMICKTCMERGKTNPSDSVDSKKITNTGFELRKEAPLPVQKSDVKEPQVEYTCSECHYVFKRRKSVIVNNCPYCDGQNTLEIKSGRNADFYIKEDDD